MIRRYQTKRRNKEGSRDETKRKRTMSATTTITTTENVVVVVVVVWRSHANRFSSFFSLTRVEKGIKRKFHSVLYTVRIVGSGTGSFSLSLSELISMSLAF